MLGLFKMTSFSGIFEKIFETSKVGIIGILVLLKYENESGIVLIPLTNLNFI